MINEFGGNVVVEKNRYLVNHSSYLAKDYIIEPDVSSACYFFAMAALTGGRVTAKNVQLSSIQGDIKFLDILGQLGRERLSKQLMVPRWLVRQMVNMTVLK